MTTNAPAKRHDHQLRSLLRRLLAPVTRAPSVALPLTGSVLLLALGCEKQPATGPAATPAAVAATTEPDDASPGEAADDDAVDVQEPLPSGTAHRSRVADNPSGWPPIEFEPAELHLGVLAPGEKAVGEARIWNVGTAPLTIVRSVTSCGCTTTDRLDGRTIPPGEALTFAVGMDPKSGLGQKKEGLRVLFSGYRVPVSYTFRAEVSLPIQAVPPHITAVDTDTNQPILSGEIELIARDGRPFRVLSSNNASPDLEGFDPAADAPRHAYTLRWNLQREHAASTVPWFWVVETDRPDARLIDLRVRHPSTVPPRPAGRPWVPKDQRVVIGDVRQGEAVEVLARLEYQPNQVSRPDTAAVRSESDRFDIQLIDATADERVVTVRALITPRPGAPGLLNDKAVVEMSGYEMPLYVIGVVK